jgi:hypothetical protein
MTIYTQIQGYFDRYNLIKIFLVILPLSLLFLFLIGWPGCLIAAGIGGFFTRRVWIAAVGGFLAGLIAWIIPLAYLLTQGALEVLNLFGAIAGLNDMGALLLIIIVLIGGLLGLIGALTGNAIATIANPYLGIPPDDI